MQKGNALLYWSKVVSLGLILGLGLQFAQAWTAPSVAPPGGNVSGPVTTGIGNQIKTGNLGVGGLQVSRDGASVIISSVTPGAFTGIEFYTAGDPTYTGGIRSHKDMSGRGELELWSNTGDVRVTGATGTNNLMVGGNIGAGIPRGSTPNGSKGTEGYIDVKDAYLRDIGKWASQLNGGVGVGDDLGNHAATQNLAMGGFNVSNAGNVYAGRLYDNNDAAYYADPNGDSVMNNLYLVNWLGITGAGSPHIEARSTAGGTPYIDFSNDAASDYDGRIILRGNDILDISGANVGIDVANPVQKLDVNGRIRMATQTASSDAADIVATKGYVDGRVSAGAPGNVVGGCGAFNNNGGGSCNPLFSCWGGATVTYGCSAAASSTCTVSATSCPAGSTLRRTGIYSIGDCGGDGYSALSGLSFICVQN